MTNPRLGSRIALSFLFAAAPVVANATGNPPVVLREMLGQAMSRGVITYPIFKRQWQVKLSPAYVTAKDTRTGQWNDLDGYGLTAAATRGLSAHWSAGLMLGYTQVKGPRSFLLRAPDGQELQTLKDRNAIRADDDGKGFIAVATAIWDHWTGDNFRLPVYMGIGYMDLEETADDKVRGLRHSGKTSSPLVAIGAAPAFNVYKGLRFTTYLMMAMPTDAGKGEIVDYNPATGRVNSRVGYSQESDPIESGVPIMGVELTYVPWGLGFGYTPPIEGATAYSLKWTRRWGPQTAAEAKD